MHLAPQFGDVLACIGIALRVDRPLVEPRARSSNATWMVRRLISSVLSSCMRLFAVCLRHDTCPRPEDLPERVEPAEAPELAGLGWCHHAHRMFVVTEAEATAIRAAFDRGGELSAAVELRRHQHRAGAGVRADHRGLEATAAPDEAAAEAATAVTPDTLI
jgi:hypothetical protein